MDRAHWTLISGLLILAHLTPGCKVDVEKTSLGSANIFAIQMREYNRDTLDLYDSQDTLVNSISFSGSVSYLSVFPNLGLFSSQDDIAGVSYYAFRSGQPPTLYKTKGQHPQTVVPFRSHGNPFYMVFTINSRARANGTNAFYSCAEIYNASGKMVKAFPLKDGTWVEDRVATDQQTISFLANIIAFDGIYNQSILYTFNKNSLTLSRIHSFKHDFGHGSSITRIGNDIYLSAAYKSDGLATEFGHEIFIYDFNTLKRRKRKHVGFWAKQLIFDKRNDVLVALHETQASPNESNPIFGVSFITPETLTVRKTIVLPGPFRMAALGKNGLLYVSVDLGNGNGKLLSIDNEAMTIRAEIPGNYSTISEIYE